MLCCNLPSKMEQRSKEIKNNCSSKVCHAWWCKAPKASSESLGCFSFGCNSQMTLHKIYFLNFSREIYVVRYINYIYTLLLTERDFPFYPWNSNYFKRIFLVQRLPFHKSIVWRVFHQIRRRTECWALMDFTFRWTILKFQVIPDSVSWHNWKQFLSEDEIQFTWSLPNI